MKNSLSNRFPIIAGLMIISGLLLVPLASAESPASSTVPAADALTPQIVAYYFHGDMRCTTCKKIEAYSEEAVTQGFSEEIDSKKLGWTVVNTDQDANKHFVEDFQLVTKSVVLVEYKDGTVVRFENLGRIWQLVGDKDDFITYVQDETRKFIETS